MPATGRSIRPASCRSVRPSISRHRTIAAASLRARSAKVDTRFASERALKFRLSALSPISGLPEIGIYSVRKSATASAQPESWFKSPALGEHRTAEDFGDAASRGGRRVVGQRVERKKPVGDDLVVGLRWRILAKIPHHKDRDVVAA